MLQILTQANYFHKTKPIEEKEAERVPSPKIQVC